MLIWYNDDLFYYRDLWQATSKTGGRHRTWIRTLLLRWLPRPPFSGSLRKQTAKVWREEEMKNSNNSILWVHLLNVWLTASIDWPLLWAIIVWPLFKWLPCYAQFLIFCLIRSYFWLVVIISLCIAILQRVISNKFGTIRSNSEESPLFLSYCHRPIFVVFFFRCKSGFVLY